MYIVYMNCRLGTHKIGWLWNCSTHSWHSTFFFKFIFHRTQGREMYRGCENEIYALKPSGTSIDFQYTRTESETFFSLALSSFRPFHHPINWPHHRSPHLYCSGIRFFFVPFHAANRFYIFICAYAKQKKNARNQKCFMCGVMLQAGFLSKIKLLVQITGEGLWWVRAGMKAKQKSRTRLYAENMDEINAEEYFFKFKGGGGGGGYNRPGFVWWKICYCVSCLRGASSSCQTQLD